MKKRELVDEGNRPAGVSRRNFCKAAAGIPLVFALGSPGLFAYPEEDPPEPEELDVPTPWKEGDPEPVEMEIPEVEPEQYSTEAPPCRPMEDECPEQPGDDYAWVSGYWWWSNRTYLWVPGYWALPPRKSLVHVAGYWKFKGTRWVYIRGGWAAPGTTAILAYAGPRPVRRLRVWPVPRRIVRRHRRWGYYADRRVRRRVNRRVNRRANRRQRRRVKRRRH